MASPTPAHHRLRILFVDDEQHLREFMRTELPRLGHEVTVCPDSRTAVETIKKATFDAAILDLRMEHDKAGLQVLAAIKQAAPDTAARSPSGCRCGRSTGASSRRPTTARRPPRNRPTGRSCRSPAGRRPDPAEQHEVAMPGSVKVGRSLRE